MIIYYFGLIYNMYPPVCSKKQLKFIWKIEYYRERLIKYITKRLTADYAIARRNVASMIYHMIQADEPDDKIYAALAKLLTSYVQRPDEHRAIDRASVIKTIVDLAQCAGGTYVDIGAADGSVTKHVGEVVEAMNIIALDIIDPPPDTDLDYRKILDGIFPVDDKTADVITAFVVLHHVKDLPTLLSEVRRVLKPGGVFIIREHDVGRDSCRVFVDVIHAVSHVIHRGEDVTEFYKEHFTFCRSASSWDNIISKYGMKKISSIHYSVENPQQIYYAAYKRM